MSCGDPITVKERPIPLLFYFTLHLCLRVSNSLTYSDKRTKKEMNKRAAQNIHFDLKVKPTSKNHLVINILVLHILAILNKKFLVENYKYVS